MCLLKKHRFPKISRKPIIVYKILEKKSGIYKTPFTGYVTKVGNTIKAKKHWTKGIFCDEINAEGVHAYTFYPSTEDKKMHIFRAEIPPYTPYWIGAFGEIAASRLKIIDIVE